MHWQRHKVGAHHWRLLAEQGRKMEVAIAIGADPASVYSGSAPLPPTIDEFIFAGFLRKAPVELTRAITVDLEVPGRGGDGHRGVHRPGGAAGHRGPVRGPHRVLLAGGSLSPGAGHRGDHAEEAGVRRHAGRPPADGRLLPGSRHRADLPAAAQAHHAGGGGLPHAGLRHLPQPRVRGDRQAVPRPGLQGHERALGGGADVARQGAGHRGQGGQRPRPRRGVVDRAQQHRSRARRALHQGAGGRAGPLQPALHLRQQDGHRRDPQVEGRGLHPRVAGADHHGRGHPQAGG